MVTSQRPPSIGWMMPARGWYGGRFMQEQDLPVGLPAGGRLVDPRRIAPEGVHLGLLGSLVADLLEPLRRRRHAAGAVHHQVGVEDLLFGLPLDAAARHDADAGHGGAVFAGHQAGHLEALDEADLRVRGSDGGGSSIRATDG